MLKVMEERRQEERREDKESMKDMIKTELKDVANVVKKEVEDAMQPWKDRTLRVEESTAEIGEEVRRLAAELRGIKEQVASRQEERSYAGVVGNGRARPDNGGQHGVATGANAVPISGTGREDQEEKARIQELLGHARRIVGLKPIDKRHVEHTKKRLEELEGETEEEKEKRAKKEAVMFFLKAEMKMKENDLKELEIVKIFAPAREEWNTLYVELASWEQASFLLSFTTFLRRGTTGEDRLEVIKYIPRDLFARFKAITALGNQARLDSGKTVNFRVSFGIEDFILQQKPRGSQGWGPPLPLPSHLPAFEHHIHGPRGARSPGQAPGRPALTPEQQDRRKRGREGGSPSGNTPSPKRQGEVVLVSEATITPVKPGEGLLAAVITPDIGSFDSITSVTPATPTSQETVYRATRSKISKKIMAE